MTNLKTAIAVFMLIAFVVESLYAKDLGSVGATYPVKEKDALSEIEERVGKVDWSRHINKDKTAKLVKSYKPSGLVHLPRAERDRTFMVDMTYILPFDIPDGKGGILYPKGYTFNPLDFVAYKITLIVLDGSDKEQVEWFKHSRYAKETTAKLLVTGGSPQALTGSLKVPVFYADGRVIEKFSLKAVPSIVTQKERVMEVKEVYVKKTQRK